MAPNLILFPVINDAMFHVRSSRLKPVSKLVFFLTLTWLSIDRCLRAPFLSKFEGYKEVKFAQTSLTGTHTKDSWKDQVGRIVGVYVGIV